MWEYSQASTASLAFLLCESRSIFAKRVRRQSLTKKMAFYSLDTVDTFNLAGFTLNTEEQAILRNSLIIKKDQEHFQNISLWGKLLGVQQDYFIAGAFNDDLFKRKYFYTYIDLTKM